MLVRNAIDHCKERMEWDGNSAKRRVLRKHPGEAARASGPSGGRKGRAKNVTAVEKVCDSADNLGILRFASIPFVLTLLSP